MVSPTDIQIVSGYPIQVDQGVVIAFFVVITSQQTILSQDSLLELTKEHETVKKIAASLGKNFTDILVKVHRTTHVAEMPPQKGRYKMIILGVFLGLIALVLIGTTVFFM